jgi:hypothetical protein
MKKQKNRWQEASTYAGIAGILLAIAPIAGPAAPFVSAAAGIAGAVAVALREG